MKQLFTFLLLMFFFRAHAQISSIDFSKYNIGEIRSTNSNAPLKCDIVYDTLVRGNLVGLNNMKMQWQISLRYLCKLNKDAPIHIRFFSKNIGSYTKQDILTCDWGEVVIYSQDFKVINDSIISVTLNKNSKRLHGPESLAGNAMVYYHVYQDDPNICPVRINTLDMASNKSLKDYLKERQFSISLLNYKSALIFEIEKIIRPSISGKVTPLKIETFSNESIFCDFILASDKNNQVYLNVLGCDGKKIAIYSLDVSSVSYGENAETYIHNLIQQLFDKLLADAATISKVNNQKESMQNTYRNDQERTQQLVYELQFYIKERENR
ncbi:MAG: hypothetical protein U0T77_00900 [Chitinophagales bacterium]